MEANPVQVNLSESALAAPLSGFAQSDRLRRAMAAKGIDAFLLTQPGACAFAAGHDRVGVHNGGIGSPSVVVTQSGDPHILTTNPDGALHLDQNRVHPQNWQPRLLIEAIESWIGRSRAAVGLDIVSPTTLRRLRACSNFTFVEGSAVLAEAMIVKSGGERERLATTCRLVHSAASVARTQGAREVYDCMAGAFPLGPWRLGPERIAISALVDGFAGEARLGVGDSSVLNESLALVRAGRTARDLAESLPPGVQMQSLGRGYELPLVKDGAAYPPELQMPAGAVVVIRHRDASVTAVVWEDRAELLSPSPEEVVINVAV
jgi:creatinase/prolidase-like protein